MITEATRDCYAALSEMVRREAKGRWLVLTHDNPDPDALASAQILARVLRQAFQQKVTVAYGGIVVAGRRVPDGKRPPAARAIGKIRPAAPRTIDRQHRHGDLVPLGVVREIRLRADLRQRVGQHVAE